MMAFPVPSSIHWVESFRDTVLSETEELERYLIIEFIIQN